ncbi:UNVERIFIED_CONTAM: hypothetical protein Sangu_2654800 [Sesamum angustifolium]|uniref:Uncharacterized protein n=1 Tax=Sesamum angustifolium TaxID=2727405 RepID=A0AAW2J1R9_9LAMI
MLAQKRGRLQGRMLDQGQDRVRVVQDRKRARLLDHGPGLELGQEATMGEGLVRDWKRN